MLIGNLPLSPKSFGKPKELKKDQKPIIQCKDTTFQQWGPLDEEILDTDVSSWLYREEDEDPAKLPKKMHPKASAIVEKMGYKGHSLGPEEKGSKAPINPISYKYNRGLGYTLVPKITIIGAPSSPSLDIESSDKEEFHEMPYEYKNDIFFDTHINAITPITPPISHELHLVHPKLID